MIRQFAEISSWRQHNLTIEPHEVFTLNFRDTIPNIFVVNNPNLATLKIGVTSIPREDSYEFKVEYNTTETVGRPIGTNNLYILNDSSIQVKIIVFSIEKDFEPSLLKNMNVSLEGYTIESNSEISGIKEGVSLPVLLSYDVMEKLQALIDKEPNITVENLEVIAPPTDLTPVNADLVEIKTLLSVLNSLGKSSELSAMIAILNTVAKSTDVTNVKEQLVNMASQTSTMVNHLATLNSIARPKNTPHYLDNETEFEYNAGMNCVLHFGWFFNDGATGCFKLNGEPVFTIYETEQFTDFEIELKGGDSLIYESDNPMFRCKYWVV